MPRISSDSAAQSVCCSDASTRLLVAIGLGVSWVGDTHSGGRLLAQRMGTGEGACASQVPFGRLGERTGLQPSDAQLCVVLADSEAYPANSRHLSRQQSPRRETGQSPWPRQPNAIVASSLCVFRGTCCVHLNWGGATDRRRACESHTELLAHRNMQPARSAYVGRLITCDQNMARPNQPHDDVDPSLGGEAAIATSAGPGASILNSGSLHTRPLGQGPALRTHFQLSTARVANVAEF